MISFPEKNDYHQFGNGYLEFDKTQRKSGGNFNDVDGAGDVDVPVSLLKIAFAYAFCIATPSTTGGEKNEQNKYVGDVLTILRLLTNKHGDLLTFFC